MKQRAKGNTGANRRGPGVARQISSQNDCGATDPTKHNGEADDKFDLTSRNETYSTYREKGIIQGCTTD